jgi:hypothetical protein
MGWQVDHFVCYFASTLIICRAWPRAIIVGGAMTAFAVLLEGLQAQRRRKGSHVIIVPFELPAWLACGLRSVELSWRSSWPDSRFRAFSWLSPG